MSTDLNQRLHHLERRLHRLQLIGTSLLVLCLSMLLLGANGPNQTQALIRTERVELLDPQGQVRAVLGFSQDHTPGLYLFDAAGREKLALLDDAQQTALFLKDVSGTTRVGIAQFAHGGGGVALHGAESKGATVMYHKGAGSLRLFDDQGQVTHRFPSPEPPAK